MKRDKDRELREKYVLLMVSAEKKYPPSSATQPTSCGKDVVKRPCTLKSTSFPWNMRTFYYRRDKRKNLKKKKKK